MSLISLKKKPSSAEIRKVAAQSQQKELKKVSKITFPLSNHECTETEPSDSQTCSFGGRKKWIEISNYGLQSTSQTQSVTDSDIAMLIR
ncbi:hypothetical protein TNCV_1345341 [Trichonephila clavipes]|nr:hypothetical protein TNCV_1345341 [Trichonephila clavipes]